MGTFKPIAMRCTQEQFDAIKPKLEKIEGVIIGGIDSFDFMEYLVNNRGGDALDITNLCKNSDFYREWHEEWDEDKFLEYCGVEVGLPKKWYVKVTDENREILNNWRKSVCDNGWKDYIMLDNCRVISEKYDGSYCAYWDEEYYTERYYQEITTEQFIKYVLKDNKPKETNQMKTKVKATEVLEIHSIACLGWKVKIAGFLKRTDSEQNIEFTQDEVNEMFDAATKEQKPVLERIFGKQEAIKWDEIKTGSKVMIKWDGQHCGGINNINLDNPVDVVFYNTPHYINSKGEFNPTGCYSKNCTFHQDGKYVLFGAYRNIEYITEVIKY